MTSAPVVAVLGGGQLGRMLALAGLPLGLRFRFLDPDPSAPAGDVGELIVGPYDDPALLGRLAQGAQAVTYEFENVPAEAARVLEAGAGVFPSAAALAAAQDRLVEKTLFRSLGLDTPEFAAVGSREELGAAAERLGLPMLVKTRRLGYDGKGQFRVRSAADLDAAWHALAAAPGGLIAEAVVPFDRELSLIAVRSRRGESAFYPLVENEHRDGILAVTRAPAADVLPHVQEAARAGVTQLLNHFGYTGVLTVEFFEVGGRLLASEMACRVHNSGHWTIDAARTSQFENHVRAILGWPLGSCDAEGHAVMLNLVGWHPDPSVLAPHPDVYLHLYAKAPRPGRKVGHLTIRGREIPEVERLASRLSEGLWWAARDPVAKFAYHQRG